MDSGLRYSHHTVPREHVAVAVAQSQALADGDEPGSVAVIDITPQLPTVVEQELSQLIKGLAHRCPAAQCPASLPRRVPSRTKRHMPVPDAHDGDSFSGFQPSPVQRS